MNDEQKDFNKEIKSDEIFQKEINLLLENAKEIEKQVFLYSKNKKIEQNKHQKNDELIENNLLENECKVDNNEQKSLERELRGLKYILGYLEKNYCFTSTYHKELSFENEQLMTEEISKQITNLYITKHFNTCYNLWRKYDFKLLIGFSAERSFDMLKYLNKIRDRYENRVNTINKIDLINSEQIDQKYNKEFLLPTNNYNFQKNNQLINNEVFNSKLNENEQLIHKLKKKIEYINRI